MSCHESHGSLEMARFEPNSGHIPLTEFAPYEFSVVASVVSADAP